MAAGHRNSIGPGAIYILALRNFAKKKARPIRAFLKKSIRFLPHDQLLRDDIVGSHHSDKVDARCQVLDIHLSTIVIDALM